ncbi:protein FAR1-RELATED SEQUENCE 6-like [Brassica napus]|uniref:protein FAR1-RELATED SEQUENCE 6-like n=1 Tax=Brassica napus TaxID=3708 RepID=UPI0006AB1226|nr:protein FAR1-RELATED SEQUENCE 6-like [Brassica napus]
MDVMKAMYGIDIDYWKAYKVLVHARELERGTWESGYEYLPFYLQKIEAANPGTITKLVCDEEDRFRYLFIAFGACITGFQFIRNVIVVDGAHLKGKFKGVILVAASQDGNGGIFPLAFGIVDSENHVSWEWFLNQLRLVYGDREDLAIISDRHKSIRKSVRKVFPLAHRGICNYHLHQNLLKKYKDSSTLNLVKKAAKVYRVSEFIALFDEIRRENPAIAAYLEKADVRLWSRAFFQGDRYDIMTSNIVESINKVLKDAREYPIAFFLDEVRKVISRWFMERREHAMSLQTLFTPRVERTLTYRCKIGNTLTVQHINAYRSHVTGGALDCVVDIRERSCTCRKYDIDKIPCEHALASADKRPNLHLQTLVHPYYTKSNLSGAYAESVNPVDVES